MQICILPPLKYLPLTFNAFITAYNALITCFTCNIKHRFSCNEESFRLLNPFRANAINYFIASMASVSQQCNGNTGTIWVPFLSTTITKVTKKPPKNRSFKGMFLVKITTLQIAPQNF